MTSARLLSLPHLYLIPLCILKSNGSAFIFIYFYSVIFRTNQYFSSVCCLLPGTVECACTYCVALPCSFRLYFHCMHTVTTFHHACLCQSANLFPFPMKAMYMPIFRILTFLKISAWGEIITNFWKENLFPYPPPFCWKLKIQLYRSSLPRTDFLGRNEIQNIIV